MPPEQANTSAPVPPEAAKSTPFFERKIVWISLVVIILLGAGAYFFVNSQPTQQIITTNSTDWKTYQNPEIGISFEYPESWGDIETEREEVCTKGLESPFGSDEAKKEKEETGDPCVGIYIGTSGSSFHESRPASILYSQSPLFAKFQPARGGNWASRISQIKDDTFIESYCTDRAKQVDTLVKQDSAACSNPQFADNFEVKYYCSENPKKDCGVFTNSQDVRIAKGFEAIDGMGGFYGWLYFIKSPNPLFPAIIVGSSGALGDVKHEEFDRFVDSIRFIQPSVKQSSQNTNTVTLSAPTTGSVLAASQKTTMRWTVPQTVASSFPSDFNLYLFTRVEKQGDTTGAQGAPINDGNDFLAGSAEWDIPGYISHNQLTTGTYKIVWYLQATPKDPARMCAETVGKDCSPNAADRAVMQRSLTYKGETGWFEIK